MSTNLPDRIGGSTNLSPLTSLSVERRRAERAVVQHAIKGWVKDQKIAIDLRSLSAAVTYATEEEISFLAYGLTRAGEDPNKLGIVARKLDLLARLNDRRITEEFG